MTIHRLSHCTFKNVNTMENTKGLEILFLRDYVLLLGMLVSNYNCAWKLSFIYTCVILSYNPPSNISFVWYVILSTV